MTGIASIGPNLPLELLQATQRYWGPLQFDPDMPIARAGEWLESKFAPWSFAVLESWSAGAYDELDQVVFSRADDSSQRLYYYVCELQRRDLIGGPVPLIFDVAKIDRASSLERMADQVRRLAELLDVTSGQLEQAISQYNLSRGDGKIPAGSRTCLLAGTPPPDGRLHDVISAAGHTPIGHKILEFWSKPGLPVEQATGDPALALARKLHADTEGPRSMYDPTLALRERIVETGAQSVILWRIEEDEAEAWHLPAQRAVLEDLGMPNLVMVRRDWLADDGVKGEIADFLEEIGA